MKPETKLKIGDTVIDARDLDHDEKVAFIEFAIHLAAPRIARLLPERLRQLKKLRHQFVVERRTYFDCCSLE